MNDSNNNQINNVTDGVPVSKTITGMDNSAPGVPVSKLVANQTNVVENNQNMTNTLPVNNDVTQNVVTPDNTPSLMSENTNPSTSYTPSEISSIPTASEEKVLINTVKKDKKSNKFLPVIIVVVILLGLVLSMDKIMGIFEGGGGLIGGVPVKDEETYNLVDGFIVVNDNTSYIKLRKVKFYNFISDSTNNSVTLNYVSDSKYDNPADLKIYIEFYNSNKEILYKELFDTKKKIIQDEVKKYTINLDNNIANKVKYALVKIYTEKEENTITTLTCRYKETEQGYDLVYKNVFEFKNNSLINYTVTKDLNILAENTTTKKYQTELKQENELISGIGVSTLYTVNNLEYKIDLTKEYNEYIPMYEFGLAPAIVKEKEIIKKWECE